MQFTTDISYKHPVSVYRGKGWEQGCWSLYYDPLCNDGNAHYKMINDGLFRFLEKSIQWTVRNESHRVAWYTDKSCMIGYQYDAYTMHTPIEFPPWMITLRNHMMKTMHLPMDHPPDGCNINLYENGYASLGAHSDNERIFDAYNTP